MDKKEIQEQRMRMYFINATKELLKGEGLKSISVRNIADRAGYSFGTLYNYFDDVKELIFICVEDFQTECREFIEERTKTQSSGKDKLRAIVKFYMYYFVQYPGIFELFFFERANDVGNKKPTFEMIYSFLDRLCRDEWKYLVEQGALSKQQARLKAEITKNMAAGMLIYYLNRHIPQSFEEFSQKTETLLDEILNF
jgi:AcrR family transcriptional regulator